MKTKTIEEFSIEFAKACGASHIAAIKGTQYETLFLIAMRALTKAQRSEARLSEEITNLCKTKAISAFISNDQYDADDYDAMLEAEDFESNEKVARLQLWEPFENYPIEDIKEFVEDEFDSLYATVKTAIEIYNKS